MENDNRSYHCDKRIQINIVGSPNGSQLFQYHIPDYKTNQGGQHTQEKQIEQKLVLEVKRRGGICPKFVSPGFDGMPDRMVLMPEGRIAFVEVKAPGEKPRPLQLARHRLLRRLGFEVYVLDEESQIEKIISEIGGDA